MAITQAICLVRKSRDVDGPLFVGIDTHALSAPALITALEVFGGNGVTTMIDAGDGYTPTPVISFAILSYNRNRTHGLADGIVITSSHNPPADGDGVLGGWANVHFSTRCGLSQIGNW